MSTTPPVPTVPKVRTFAADLTATRNKRGNTVPEPRVMGLPPIGVPSPKVGVPMTTKLKTMPKPVLSSAPKVITVVTKITPPVDTATTPTSVTEKAIPPFHTLNKNLTQSGDGVTKIDTSEFNALTKIVKPSVLATPGIEQMIVNSKDPSPGDSGTIITDTKHKRFSLFGAISTSLHDWWGEKKHEATQRKIPKYTIPEAERRKGVIQKATTQTGRTSTSDHAAVMSRIKSSHKTVRRSSTTVVPEKVPVGVDTETASVDSFITVVIPPSVGGSTTVFAVSERIKSTETAVAAEPFAETSSIVSVGPITPREPILPIPIVRPLIKPIVPVVPQVTEIPVAPIVPVVVPNAPEEPSIKTIAERLQELEDQAAGVNVTPTPAPPVTPLVTPIVRPRITPIMPQNVNTVVTKEVFEPKPPIGILVPLAETPVLTEPTVRPKWSLALPHNETTPAYDWKNKVWLKTIFAQTNRMALGVASGIGVVLVIWYSGQSYVNWRVASQTPTALHAGTLFADSSLIATTTTLTSKKEFIETVTAFEIGNDAFTEMVITDPITGESLSATQLFTLMNTHVDSSLSAAITHLYLGEYHNEPWIILRSNEGAAVQGGMLAWENTLDTDLIPWFSTTTIRTTKKGITRFHDEVIAGHDVRILSDNDGHERIVYGFVTPTRILITTSPTAFLNLAEKSQGTGG